MQPLNRVVVFIIVLYAGAANGQFTFKDDGVALTVLDGGRPVLAYNYGWVKPPAGADEARYTRSCYIHPVWGPHGEIVTEDFPSHHLHQRGLFWAWPDTTLGARRVDTWTLDGARQHFIEFTLREASHDHARIDATNHWRFDGVEGPIAEELITIAVSAETETGRAIDIELILTNKSKDAMTLRGAKDKGYGGVGICPDTKRKPFVLSTKDGALKEDALSYDTPWGDVTLAPDINGETCGVAIFQHPANPGFPHKGWMFRAYGYMGAAWPHEAGHTLMPDESVVLRYRMLIHRGTADDARVAEAFAAYQKESRPESGGDQ